MVTNEEEQDLEAWLTTESYSDSATENTPVSGSDKTAWDFIESTEAEDIWRMVTAKKVIQISKWEQFGTIKSIGGVHSGKIMLFMIEGDDGSKMLVDGNN